MKLIKILETRRNKYGKMERWGKYECLICLNIFEITIKQGNRNKSCGCDQHTFIKQNKIALKHGGTGTKLYNTWKNIKKRILNPNNPDYKYYGGRGISICNEWLEFTPFRDWALSNGYEKGLEIDRENTDGNYEPSNCRWVTHEKNIRNTKRVIFSMKKANEIRELYDTGDYIQQELAEKYNVDQTKISKIILNKLWRN